MKNLLRIDSSIFGDAGNSQQLTAFAVEQLIETLKNSTLVQRDLAQNPPQHFDSANIAAIGEGKAKDSDRFIEEVENADILIIGAPMYNFTIPSQLKTWLDHIARAGRTFTYTDNGPVGLLSGKKVYVVTTRGGIHRDTENDNLVPYLKTMLGFLGLAEDLHFIYAEGLAMSDSKETSIANAKIEIQQLVETAAAETEEAA